MDLKQHQTKTPLILRVILNKFLEYGHMELDLQQSMAFGTDHMLMGQGQHLALGLVQQETDLKEFQELG